MAADRNLPYSSEILFSKEGFRTDLLLYKERAALLIPGKNGRNQITVVGEDSEVRFFIGSTESSGLSYLKAFFSKLYPVSFDDTAPPDLERLDSVVIKPSQWQGRKKNYSAGFMRTIIQGLSAIEGFSFRMDTIIESHRSLRKRMKYSFAVRIELSGDPVHFEKAKSMVQDSISQTRSDGGLRLKSTARKRFRLQRKALKDPYLLSSVVRVPEDENLI